MTERTGSATPPLTGRLPEREVLVALLDRAADGEAGTILIGGSAGVGKTTLVQAAVAGRDAIVATGGCLPLVAVTVPFMAIRAAMASVADRADPSAGGLASGDAGATMFERFDRWLDALCAEAPVVLVIEDLHWADQFSLDTLMYVIAGPARRRLAVVLTMRDDELGEDHRLHRWLADTRRLPRFAELALQPFDRLDTAEQLAGLLGELPHQALIEEVHSRSGGNPLLVRLLATGLASDARQLPAALPANLRQAVLRAWFGLTPATRGLVGVLAIGGHPLRAAELAAVVGVDVATVRAHLAAAVAAGVLDPARDDVYWFNHPLYAEALEDAVAPDDRRRWHAALADRIEPRSAEEAGIAAAHRFHAGDLADAYHWALRAAEWHVAEGTPAESIPMLHRALALRERVDAPESREQLLVRLRHAAADAGAYGEELGAVDALLAGTSPDTRPRVVAELLVRRTQLHLFTGRRFYGRDDLRRALRLAAGAPDSPEYALALAELGHAELWHGEEEGLEHARAALSLARAAGDDRALCLALSANAFAELYCGTAARGLGPAAEAFTVGLRSRDWWGCVSAVFWEANCSGNWSSAASAAVMSARREELARAGAPHPYLAWLASNQAFTALTIGSWQESAQILRKTLASDPGPVADVEARLCSARLAVWQGRQREAEQHLARADELFAARSEFLAFEFDAVRAEVLLGAGDPWGAHAAALAGLGMARALPSMCEWLVPLAARALGDQAESARDAGQDQSAVLAAAEDLHSRHPQVVRDVGPVWPEYDRQCRALDALYAAELDRVRADPDEGRLWSEAADALAEVAFAWETAYACRRGAEALLGRGHDRTAGAALLRRGLDLTEALAAEPLREQLLALARRARVPTRQVVPVDAATTGPTAITTREREILALLVAGRTYAEIATELVISEKTVSSHVSHLLAKTGTSNRVELAGFAERAHLAAGPAATAAAPPRSGGSG